MTIKEQEIAVGGLSNPSKMPGLSYGIPAIRCIVGSILRKVKGSVCSKCYARKGMYSFPVVQKAQANRLEILSSDIEAWADNMVELIGFKYHKKKGDDRVFRWHDSGDIQSENHLTAIASIALSLPDILFWIPTKEYAVVRKWVQEWEMPENLIIRVSAPMIGASTSPISGTVSSTVGYGKGFQCPAYSQGGKCGDCRACWDKTVISVDYPQH